MCSRAATGSSWWDAHKHLPKSWPLLTVANCVFIDLWQMLAVGIDLLIRWSQISQIDHCVRPFGSSAFLQSQSGHCDSFENKLHHTEDRAKFNGVNPYVGHESYWITVGPPCDIHKAGTRSGTMRGAVWMGKMCVSISTSSCPGALNLYRTRDKKQTSRTTCRHSGELLTNVCT